MSLKKTIFHIDRGPTDMYPVDAAQAVGQHPFEWSLVPWTDETRAAAKPHLEERARRQAEEQKTGVANTLIDGKQVAGAQLGGETGDPKTNAEVVKRLQGDADAAKADLDKAESDLATAKANNDERGAVRAQAVVDKAKARHDEAQNKLDAAKKS